MAPCIAVRRNSVSPLPASPPSVEPPHMDLIVVLCRWVDLAEDRIPVRPPNLSSDLSPGDRVIGAGLQGDSLGTRIPIRLTAPVALTRPQSLKVLSPSKTFLLVHVE